MGNNPEFEGLIFAKTNVATHVDQKSQFSECFAPKSSLLPVQTIFGNTEVAASEIASIN